MRFRGNSTNGGGGAAVVAGKPKYAAINGRHSGNGGIDGKITDTKYGATSLAISSKLGDHKNSGEKSKKKKVECCSVM